MAFVNLVAAGWNQLTEWRRREQAYAELMSLDDRSLADIGIHRSQIPAIVEGMDRCAGRAAERVPASRARIARRQVV